MKTLQDSGIMLGIALIGVKLGVFDKAFSKSININEYIVENNLDKLYVEKWILSAYSYGFIEISDGFLSLTTEGKKYSKEGNNSEFHNLIQSIFSLLISYESLNWINTGERPGYSINEKFGHISEWYSHVNKFKNLATSTKLLERLNSGGFFNSIKGNIADYGCGNGWFLTELKKYVSSCPLFGIDEHDKVCDKDLSFIPSKEFFSDSKSYSLIILNKVLHHIWNDKMKIEQIINKLDRNGYLLIWEFSWEKEILDNKNNKELIFLSYVEHIQNARFLDSKEITDFFVLKGMKVKKYLLDSKRQFCYLVSKKIKNNKIQQINL